MKTAPFRSIWRQLSPAQKNDLAERVDSTYGSLKCVATRGRCGRRMLRDIAVALHDMGEIEGPSASAFTRTFKGKAEPVRLRRSATRKAQPSRAIA